MSKGFASTGEYLYALADLYPKLLQGDTSALCALRAQEEESDCFLPLASVRRMLGLGEREYALLALWIGAAVRGEAQRVRTAFSEGCAAEETVRSNAAFISLLLSDGRGGVRPCRFCEDFLLGREPVLPRGMTLEMMEPDQTLLHDGRILEEMLTALTAWEQEGSGAVAVALTGSPGCGRRFLFRMAAGRMGRALLCVDTGRDYPFEELRELAAAALLSGAIVCLTGYPGKGSLDAAALAEQFGVVFLSAAPGTQIQMDCPLLVRSLGALSAQEREQACRAFFDGIPFADNVHLGDMPGMERMGIGTMQGLSLRLRAESLLGPVGEHTLRQSIRETEGTGLPSGARASQTRRGLAELVLPQAQYEQFQRLCRMARARKKVTEEWGFAHKLPYGKGMTVLFYGPSGTGKTMAAEVLAHELGYELWRIDMTQLISKYIGETQKNIAQVFDAASGRECVLFFDEADALFSRRSEVTDAQDRYANAEIACLLQQTEQYDGITVLSTNLFQNFDEAFRRRITHFIRFPIPDAAARHQLWERAFPREAPVDGVDFAALAEGFELTGAGIQNSVVYAACLAAAEGKPIGMPHLLQGIRNEYDKMGKTFASHLTRLLGEGNL